MTDKIMNRNQLQKMVDDVNDRGLRKLARDYCDFQVHEDIPDSRPCPACIHEMRKWASQELEVSAHE